MNTSKVYVVIGELWWHAVATAPVCVYSDKSAAEYHVAILKEKGWHASVSELDYDPNPEEFTSTCTPRKEFEEHMRKQMEMAKE
jgi:hypothetical protein